MEEYKITCCVVAVGKLQLVKCSLVKVEPQNENDRYTVAVKKNEIRKFSQSFGGEVQA